MTNDLSTPNVFEPLIQVNGSSEGSVSRPTWNPSFGYDTRRKAIEDARKAEEERQQAIEEADPINLRLAKLEGQVARMQARLKLLEKE